MRAVTPVIAAIFTFGMATTEAWAAEIIPPHDTWEYTFTDPTSSEPNWNNETNGGVGIWSSGPAPFGNVTGGRLDDTLGYFDFATLWNDDRSDGDDLWVRHELDLTHFDLSTVAWDLGVDNGYKLYLNGQFVSGDNAEQYTYRWEYSGTLRA